MNTVLVTGATGTLGTPTVAQLRRGGHDVRALSRRTGPGLTTGNLLTGAGLASAVAGVDTVVHLSTGKDDVEAASNLVTAARAAGVRHVILISIVGIDNIPLPYYRDKLAIETLVSTSAMPFTILRSTQFHQLIARICTAQRLSPVLWAPSFKAQPIHPVEVATRLVELVGADAAGRVADIGGPERRPVREFEAMWADAAGTRRPIWPLRMPGKIFSGFAAGNILVPGEPYGRRTFAEFLAERDARSE